MLSITIAKQRHICGFYLIERLPDVSILVFADWVNVLAHGSLKQVR